MSRNRYRPTAKQKRRRQLADARYKRRKARLSLPITLLQVAEFSTRLVRIDYGRGGECWMYPSKGKTGASRAYGNFSFNGVAIGPHRFALAVKLGRTLWSLNGYDAAHASKSICMGGTCCNPEHLLLKPSEPNRSWDRGRDAIMYGDKVTTRTNPQAQRMVAAMYPGGLQPNAPLFDDPCQQNVSPQLMAFLEMGLREEFKKMRLTRDNGGDVGQ